ncbi:MAG: phosphoribosyl-ATP diphosphatase [Chloroflexota bacterium]|jgi:phosphoribosyl-ATP pyrophosphohydrolase
MRDVITELQAVLQSRQANPTADSYTARLLEMGEDEIVKKIGEEAVEVILAVKGQGDERVIEETADLIYHLLVLLVSRHLTWEDLLAELAQRQKE